MRRYVAYAAIVAGLLVASLGLTVLVAEWRYDRLADDLSDIRTSLDELQVRVDRPLTPEPEPWPTAPPIPTPPGETIVVTAKDGLVLELRGMRFTVQTYTPARGGGGMTVSLKATGGSLENWRADAFDYAAVDYQGYLCQIDTFEEARSSEPGESLVFRLWWSCPRADGKTLFIDHYQVFLPAAPRP